MRIGRDMLDLNMLQDGSMKQCALTQVTGNPYPTDSPWWVVYETSKRLLESLGESRVVQVTCPHCSQVMLSSQDCTHCACGFCGDEFDWSGLTTYGSKAAGE